MTGDWSLTWWPSAGAVLDPAGLAAGAGRALPEYQVLRSYCWTRCR
ncbi:hypothetical protein GXW82_07025 [Streptacidiphilus sp. 4-A2]|nr:hypothetical protein [Streptacidiphilus sp. 4-A2]